MDIYKLIYKGFCTSIYTIVKTPQVFLFSRMTVGLYCLAKLQYLVSEARFVWQFAEAYSRNEDEMCKRLVNYGAKSLLSNFHDPICRHYQWTLNASATPVRDDRAVLYGHAFAFMAMIAAFKAGVHTESAAADLCQFMESKFYDEDYRAYADEWDPQTNALYSYRGQNANLHACEACIYAYSRLHDEKYLDRAIALIETFVFR
eukprot:TRINITY_DN10285_c0_g1_i2.p3 TRINITY_DN10285_c0_g1~~TRINITY_DN10285_c0_g1_i2.p3  ORF type:complete len:203 (+),score=6.18 TRINITY_DN10285_c0_g1_i2:4204-4812(+)